MLWKASDQQHNMAMMGSEKHDEKSSGYLENRKRAGLAVDVAIPCCDGMYVSW